MAEQITLPVQAGATFNSLSFKYFEDDGVTPVPLDSLKLQIRETPASSLAVEVIPSWDAETGLIEFELSAAQTSSLVKPEYVWAMEVVLVSGETVRLAQGKVRVSPEVVR